MHAVRGYRVDGRSQARFQRSRAPRTRSEHAMESPASFSISESANRKYPTADPKSRLLSRGARKSNASHRAADAASFLVTASNTKSSRVSIAGTPSPGSKLAFRWSEPDWHRWELREAKHKWQAGVFRRANCAYATRVEIRCEPNQSPNLLILRLPLYLG